MKEIISALKTLNIKTYRINEVRTESCELFFVKKQLQVRRIKDVTVTTVTVFRDKKQSGQRMRGSSAVCIAPGMTGEEIARKLASAYESAKEAADPFYELYEGKQEEEQAMPSGFAALSLREGAERMAAAIYSADTRTDAFINSTEVFMERIHNHILTSAGTDAAFTRYECNGEFVTQCKKPQDVEQHYSFRYGEPAAEELSKKAAEGLKTVCDRARAKESPAGGSYDLVLSGERLATLLSMYLERADAGSVYAKYSDYSVGKVLQGEDATGEKLNLTLLPGAPFSEEGIPMAERKFIEDGKLLTLYGNTRFCRYLGLEPTGSYERLRLEAGTVPFDEMKKGCLYPVSFSDFQMDGLSGRFGGEIRLAYLFTEDGVKVLTGGSVSGSLLEKQGELTFSKERFQNADYEGPFAVRIPSVSVSGC